MAIDWFIKKPGSDWLQSKDDPTAFMHDKISSGNRPQVIMLPEEIGGGQRAVQNIFENICICGKSHKVLHYDLGDIHIAECNEEYMWYRKPE